MDLSFIDRHGGTTQINRYFLRKRCADDQLTDAEIGQLANISPRTVQRHITNILDKLNCKNRSHAVAQVIGAAPPLSLVRPTFDDGELAQGARQ